VIEKLLPMIQVNDLPDKIMGADELSQFIGKSKDQIYQWVNQSQHGLSDFPYLKAGRSLRFSQNAILQWMKSNGKTLKND
jgi:predicted DNA-binding transcriptional regulator AlpA